MLQTLKRVGTFSGAPMVNLTQELGSRDPFGQYLEVGARGCEYCSLGSRFNTPFVRAPGSFVRARLAWSTDEGTRNRSGHQNDLQEGPTTSELSFSNPFERSLQVLDNSYGRGTQ